jgi:glycerol uptake facilitator-like aquaporin
LIESAGNDGNLITACGSGISGHCLSPGLRGRLGNHGRAFGRRERRDRTACEYDCTGAALAALILTFGPISGAHFNPAVSLADALERGLRWNDGIAYIVAQMSGGLTGAIAAHAMFGLPAVSLSKHARSGGAQVFSEFVATFGLLCVIWGCSRTRSSAVPFAVAGYITAAYWFTASTSFANPAVTIARTLSDTFAGIRPVDAPWFVAAQMAGAIAATILFRWLAPGMKPNILVS